MKTSTIVILGAAAVVAYVLWQRSKPAASKPAASPLRSAITSALGFASTGAFNYEDELE